MNKTGIPASILGAAAIVAAALILTQLTDHGVISRRIEGIFGGLIIAIAGNFIPKELKPLSDTRCEPSRRQSLQRRVGWTFVITGLLYTIVWLTVPIDTARILSASIAAAGALIALTPCAWAALSRRRVEPRHTRT